MYFDAKLRKKIQILIPISQKLCNFAACKLNAPSVKGYPNNKNKQKK